MLQTYQHLPEFIDPIALTIGSFSVRWYSLMYLVGWAVIYGLLSYRIRREEYDILKIPNKSQTSSAAADKAQNLIFDLLMYCFFGLLIGARLGYVVLYDFSYFIKNPLEIILPFQVENFKFQISNLEFTGLYGMSYFGGLAGALCAGYVFARKKKLNFWRLANFVMPAIPAGYFWGRIGNFLNGELYGRPTEKMWGMFFPGDSQRFLRHPSQLYEAFFEGLVLLGVLWWLRNNKKIISGPGLLPIYLFGYGFFRFLIEFLREPDVQLGLFFGLTLGQILALLLMAAATALGLWKKRKTMLQ